MANVGTVTRLSLNILFETEFSQSCQAAVRQNSDVALKRTIR